MVIGKSVDADEELAAIVYMATRTEKTSALLFENLASDKSGSRVLANMLGSSKERYALAVGLDPDLSIAEMIQESRAISEPEDRTGSHSEIEGAGERGRAHRR